MTREEDLARQIVNSNLSLKGMEYAIANAIRGAVMEEREECAKLAETGDDWRGDIAKKIRERSK